MKRTVYYILPRGKGWGVKVKGKWVMVSNRARWDWSKREWVLLAKWLAQDRQPSEVIVHNRNGKIGTGGGSRTTYGRDPEKSKG